MSDQMLSLLGNIKTAKEEIERLRSSLEDSQSESERLREALAASEEREAGLTAEQIDKRWKYLSEIGSKGVAEGYEQALYDLGFRRCEECGGGVSKAWDNGCPSCHGHGWIITSVDVDKYGRIGTGEE